MKKIYLDNAASMPMPKKVVESISKASEKYYANSFSLHAAGREAWEALNDARKDLAGELGVKPEEIILTSGGTESNALALLGVAKAKKDDGKNKIIVSSIEHSSVYENAKMLEKVGFILKEIPVNEQRGIDFDFLEKEVDNKTAIVIVMSVSSETGIINDIAKIAKICKQKGAILHVDHSQGFGKIPLQPKTLGVDMVTADAHKIGGPKGIGLVYITEKLKIDPLFKGAEQEGIIRPGTINVAGAVGFAVALKEYKKTNFKKIGESRDALQAKLEETGARVTAKNLPRVPNILHVCFKDAKGEEVVNYLSVKGIYCSTGSACDSYKKEKRILKNLEVPEEYRSGAVRFSLSQPLSEKEISYVASEVRSYLNRFKKEQKQK